MAVPDTDGRAVFVDTDGRAVFVDTDGRAVFEVTSSDSTPVLVFRPHGVTEPRWADFHALDLEVPALDGAAARPERANGDGSEDGRAVYPRRWLGLKDALLVTSERALAQPLARLRLHDAGISDLRLVPSWDAFQLLGRVVAGDRQAAFSIRLAIGRSPRHPRYLLIDLANVRLFGFIETPAPHIAGALAGALAREMAAACPAHVAARGARVELDVLEVALDQSLVARGWRLPRLHTTQLVALDWVANQFQVHFSSASPAASSTGADRRDSALVEGDLTVESCRRRCAEAPDDGLARGWWLAFRVAAGEGDAAALASEAIARSPADASPHLWAAIVAAEANHPEEASRLFLEAARVAEDAGELADAELARQAAELQVPRATAPPVVQVRQDAASPVTPEPAPPEAVTAPPEEEEAQPKEEEETTALQEETAALEEETTALQEETAAPEEEETTALQEETAALEEETIALEEETAALEEETIALEEETAALEEETTAPDLASFAEAHAGSGGAAPEAPPRDLASDASDLTAALRSLPPTALEQSLELEEKLAEVHFELRDWATAEGWVTRVLHRDPARIGMLERMVEIHEQLDRHEAAAQTWARLAQLYPSPRERAQALFREGEIRREILGDASGALAAYLRSSDLDATFVPTARQLLAHFWRTAAFEDAASVGQDLASVAGALAELDVRERVRLAAASRLAGGAASPPRSAATPLAGIPFRPDIAAAVLVEVSVARLTSPPRDLGPVASLLREWAKSAGAAAPETVLRGALRDGLLADLAEPGVARALGMLYDAADGDRVLACVHYALAVFLEPTDGAAGRLSELAGEGVASARRLPEWAASSPSLLAALEQALASDPMFGPQAEELSESERRTCLLRMPRMLELYQTSTEAEAGDAVGSRPPSPA